MSMDVVSRGHGGARLGGGKPSNAIADKKKRYNVALRAAEYAEEVIALYVEVMRDKELPIATRMEAGERLLNRGLGRPPIAVESSADSSAVHHTYEVRWLPPDPNDHSRVIEPC
jgi:hypothetical protein